MNNNPVLNIAHSNINKNISILYSPSYSLFDIIIKDSTEYSVFFTKDIVRNYYYDMYFSNNFFQHTNDTKNVANKYHLKDVVAFHSEPPKNFKKEDIAILFKDLSKSHKIFFGQDIAKSWKQTETDDISIIEYGVPQIGLENAERNKNVLIINAENNNQIEQLHKHISSQIPSCDIINAPINTSLSSLTTILSSYNILVDFGNRINTLMAIACGTVCITPLALKCPLSYQITNYNDISSIISNILVNQPTENIRTETSKAIQNTYNYDKFNTKITETFKYIKNNKVFIL